ncbi:hypothetical protein AMECASPLE_019476 [Ameca splendens]|uniref:Uncharacterized protein n=1 Tax=Ameca splendens TaxID=208324 RepID=A0ABV0ZMT4_9TELE
MVFPKHSFMSLVCLPFSLSSVFPVLSFSTVYTSVVIYLLFCGSNVVSICLALFHSALICSQLQNHMGIEFACCCSFTKENCTGTWGHIQSYLVVSHFGFLL